jgi:hypothetical protein
MVGSSVITAALRIRVVRRLIVGVIWLTLTGFEKVSIAHSSFPAQGRSLGGRGLKGNAVYRVLEAKSRLA